MGFMLFFCDILSLTTCFFTVEWQLPGVSIYVYAQEAAMSTKTLNDLILSHTNHWSIDPNTKSLENIVFNC